MPRTQLTMEEARAFSAGPLGREVASVPELYATPIHTRSSNGTLRSGTTFFLDCGRGVFGVTAGHVYDALVCDVRAGSVCYLGVGAHASAFDLPNRLIARGQSVDIATYRADLSDVAAAGVRVLTHQDWPPPAPRVNQGLIFGGFPGVDRRSTPHKTEFVGTSGAGIADSVNDHDISCVLDRDFMTPVGGTHLPEVGHDFAGMSGSPALAIVNGDILSWHLAGVVYECARELMECIKIVRADLIGADGSVT